MNHELAVTYLGLELISPVIVGSCPLTMEPETVRQLISAGAGAIVLPSMLQEQILHARMKPLDPFAAIEQSGYQPQQDKYNGGTEKYLETIRLYKDTYRVPIIASINGTPSADWLDYAKEIESSGADALEINLASVIAGPDQTASQIESELCDMVKRVVQTISIPVAVKIGQRFTNVASIAKQFKDAGAAGMVLFTHQPHWDVSIERMNWTIRWELSPADSLGAILEGIVRVRAAGSDFSIAASGGVRTCEDAIKSMIAGADAVMLTSEIYREGPTVIRSIVDGITRYLELNHHETLGDFQHERPKLDIGSERLMRLEYVDPLTRSNQYYDPTPAPTQETCDLFGHKSVS